MVIMSQVSATLVAAGLVIDLEGDDSDVAAVHSLVEIADDDDDDNDDEWNDEIAADHDDPDVFMIDAATGDVLAPGIDDDSLLIWSPPTPKHDIPQTTVAAECTQCPVLADAATIVAAEMSDGSFLRILSTGTDRSGDFLRGYRLLRQDQTSLFSQECPHELVWIVSIADEAQKIPGQHRRRAADVVRSCRVIFTNQAYGDLNTSHDFHVADEGDGELFFCRWKRVAFGNEKEGRIERLTPAEADECLLFSKTTSRTMPTHAVAKSLRQKWRGPQETAKCLGSKFEVVDDDISVQKYTFGDSFCGAGGTSEGAKAAGLALTFAFDVDPEAMASYVINHGHTGVECRCQNVHVFLNDDSVLGLVDVLHLSPPCQPFSKANTTPNIARNEINENTLTSVWNLLKKCKPRIVTLEETDGLFNYNHRVWFNLLVSFFVELGYSLEWKVLSLNDYGVPQTRNRLIIIAAGPGDTLPPYPRPTHGMGSALQNPPTIAAAIDWIPVDAPDHEIATTHHFATRKAYEVDAHGLSNTVTCAGGMNVFHPCGLRHYTTRELACLQTFHQRYHFEGSLGAQKRQIGNAVPPRFATTLFSTVRRWLEDADQREKDQSAKPRSSRTARNVIVIDDS